MGALGSDISEFDEPISTQFPLYGEIPLLGGGCNPVERNLQADEAVHVASEAGTALIGIGRGISVSERATGREAGEERSTGYESRTQHSQGRNSGESGGGVWLEEVGQAACSRQEVDRDGEEWSGKGQVIDCAQVLAHAVDAVAAADSGGVTAKQIVGEADARLPNGGVFILECSLIERS